MASETRENIVNPPLHPLLVIFPLGFAIATLAADVIGFAYYSGSAWTAAYYFAIAACCTGVAAGIPAVLDLLPILRSPGPAKHLALLHAALNGAALLLLLAAWLMREVPPLAPSAAAVALEGLAAFVLIYGGMLGHVLLYGKDTSNRGLYAQPADFGSSVDFEASDKPVRVAAIDELKINQMRLIRLGERRIVIARTDRGVCAFDDNCSHQGCSLAEGVMLACSVLCPRHGSKFDALTGQVKSGSARKPLKIYRVEVRGGDVYLHPHDVPEAQDLHRAANI